MYGPDVAILLTYGSHDMRHTGFHRLTVVNETPGFWGVTSVMSLNMFKHEMLCHVFLSHKIKNRNNTLTTKYFQYF